METKDPPVEAKQPWRLYVLVVGDDTPYQEGFEFWFRTTIRDLLEIIKEEWDWMSVSELNLNLATKGQRMITIAEINGIKPNSDAAREMFFNVPDNDNEFLKSVPGFRAGGFTCEKFAKLDFPILPKAGVPDQPLVCTRCVIVGDGTCPECGEPMVETDDKVKF